MSLVAFPNVVSSPATPSRSAIAALPTSAPLIGRSSTIKLPPRFLARSNSRASKGRLGASVVSPLFSCRPWLQDDPALQLGWDHAHHGTRPSLEALCASLSLKQGYQAALAVFGRRTLPLTPYVKAWLALRLEALERGRDFDVDRVNPRYLAQISTRHCPVTRQATRLGAADTVIVRLRNDVEYAAGNLLMMSRSAYVACGRAGRPAGSATPIGSRLDVDDKSRLDVLRSFGEAQAHRSASQIPLLVLPPNRLQIRNPVQALQALASRALASGSDRFDALRAAMPGKGVRDDVDGFAMAYIGAVNDALRDPSRSLAGPSIVSSDPVQPDVRTQRRWAIEDAWKAPDVQRHWQRLAGHLDACEAERIVGRIGGPGGGVFVSITPDDDVLPPPRAAEAGRLRA